MAATYDLIQSVEIAGTGSTVTFTSIPSTYTDLVIEGHLSVVIASGACDFYLRFNNDTGSNYYGQGAGSNTTPVFRSDAYNVTGAILMGVQNSMQLTGNPVMFEAQINEYANGSYTKNGVHNWSYLVSGTAANVGFGAFQWRNTTAINRVDVLSTNGGALTGRVSLYGILAGNA